MQGEELEVDAEAIAWTKRGVQIRYIDRRGRPDMTWLWAGAVRRIVAP